SLRRRGRCRCRRGLPAGRLIVQCGGGLRRRQLKVTGKAVSGGLLVATLAAGNERRQCETGGELPKHGTSLSRWLAPRRAPGRHCGTMLHLRRILPAARPYWGTFAAGFLCVLVSNFFTTLAPRFLQ